MSSSAPTENPPQQNVQEVFAHWMERRKKTVGPVSTDGTTIFSYAMPLLTRASSGHVIVAERKKGAYSVTTAKHLKGLHDLLEPHIGAGRMTVLTTDAPRIERGLESDTVDDIVIKLADEPLRLSDEEFNKLVKFERNPPSRDDVRRLVRELEKWADHKPYDRALVTRFLRPLYPQALDINADREFWFGEVVDDLRRRLSRMEGFDYDDAFDEDLDQAVMSMTGSWGQRDRRAQEVARAAGYRGETAHGALRRLVERKRHREGRSPLVRLKTAAELGLTDEELASQVELADDIMDEIIAEERALRAAPPSRRNDFEENPPWASRLLADSLVSLSEAVTPAWMPKLAASSPGKGTAIRIELEEYGCGAYGCVMPTIGDKNVVIKLTSDPSEAKFATEIAGKLPTPCVVRYHQAVQISGERHGRDVFVLWREAADAVGQIHKVVGKHAEKAIAKQHRAAVDAYLALVHGDTEGYFELLEDWKRRCMEMARVPELEYVAIGMLRAWNEQGVFISDTHGGNLGLCQRNGKMTWVITDPGNVVVSRAHADERSRLRTKRVANNPDETPAVKYHGSIEKMRRDHAEMIANDAKWSALAYVGIQPTWDDDDNEIELELRNCPCGSTLSRELPRKNPQVPKRGAMAFFQQYAGYGWTPGQETRRGGRLRSARELAVAEYVLEEEHPDARVDWEEDPEAFSLYPEEQVDTYYIALLRDEDGDVLASLGAIGDPDANYERVVEAELAYEAWPERVRELAARLQQRRGAPFRVNPEIDTDAAGRWMRIIVDVSAGTDPQTQNRQWVASAFSTEAIVQRYTRTFALGGDRTRADLVTRVRNVLRHFVRCGLVDETGDPDMWILSERATRYDNAGPARFPDYIEVSRGSQDGMTYVRQVLSSAELSRYLRSFMQEPNAWRVDSRGGFDFGDEYGGASSTITILTDASAYGINVTAAMESTAGREFRAGTAPSRWPVISIFIVAHHGAAPLSRRDGFQLEDMPFPRSPMELAAMVVPLMLEYHP